MILIVLLQMFMSMMAMALTKTMTMRLGAVVGRTLHSSRSKALYMEPRLDLGNHPRKKARDLMPLRHRSAPKEELQGRLFLADIGGPVRGF